MTKKSLALRVIYRCEVVKLLAPHLVCQCFYDTAIQAICKNCVARYK